MMSKKNYCLLITAAICILVSLVFAASPNFVPDVTFKGSVLTGWHKLGPADWRAENGEIIGMPKEESGGWEVLDKGYQDIVFYSSFPCRGTCKGGVLLRAGKTATGMKGVYVSLSKSGVGSFQGLPVL